MVKTNIQTFTGEVEILSNLHVGPSGSSYLTANGAAYTTNWLENETPYEIFADKAGTIKESIKSPFSFFKNNESPCR